MARTRFPRVALVLAATMIVAACGSDESSTTTSAPTAPPASTAPPTTRAPAATTPVTTVPPTTAAPTTAPPATEPPATVPPTTEPAPASTAPPPTTGPLTDDQVLAQQALLTIDDFPDGWVALPPDEDDESDPAMQEQFEQCLGAGAGSVMEQLDGREVTSPKFDNDDLDLVVEHEVLLADDEAMAIAAMEEVGVEGAATCMEAVLQPYTEAEVAADPDLPPGTTIGQITVDRVESAMDPTIVVEYFVTLPFDFDGQLIDFYLDVYYLRQGRALSMVQFQSVAAPFDPDGIAFLGSEILARLASIGN